MFFFYKGVNPDGSMSVTNLWLLDGYEVAERTMTFGQPFDVPARTVYLGPAPRHYLELRHAELRAWGFTLVAARPPRDEQADEAQAC